MFKAVTVNYDVTKEFEEDGLVYLCFKFNDEPFLQYISLSRSIHESIDGVYLEINDQVNGFVSKDISYILNGSVLDIMLSDTDQNIFLKDNLKKITVGFPTKFKCIVLEKLAIIFDKNHEFWKNFITVES